MRILIKLLRGKKVELPGVDGVLTLDTCKKMQNVVNNMVVEPVKIDLLEICSNAHSSEIHVGATRRLSVILAPLRSPACVRPIECLYCFAYLLVRYVVIVS